MRCCCHHGVGLYFSGAIRSRLIARQYALQILCRSWRSHPVSPLSGRNPRVTASRSYRGSGLNRRAPRYSSFLPAQPTCNRHFADATLRTGWRRCFQRIFICRMRAVTATPLASLRTGRHHKTNISSGCSCLQNVRAFPSNCRSFSQRTVVGGQLYPRPLRSARGRRPVAAAGPQKTTW